EDGAAIVTDFGIAKVAQDSASVATQTNAIVGTPAYISPEQCYSHPATAASDQYSLGVVAFELLTGRPPYSGSAFAIMQAHTDRPVPPIGASRVDCPPDLEHAVMRMLEKEPEHRWPSMQHALAELKAAPVFEGDPVHRALVQLAIPSVMTRWEDVAGGRASKRGTQRPASHAPPTAVEDAVASEPEPALAPPTFVTAVAIQVPVRTIHVGDVFSLSAS